MNKETLKREIEIREIKNINKQLINKYSLLNKQYNNLNDHFEKRVNDTVKNVVKNELKVLKKENKKLQLEAAIKEDVERRLRLTVSKKNETINSLKEENKKLQKEIERLKAIQNNDNSTAGIPTSMTPINKKKIIPNSRKNTGEKIGRKNGHKKDKLERIEDEKIDQHIKHELKECPNCKKEDLIPTGKIISKDVKDYKIIVYNTRHDYTEYKCNCCGKIVHEQIPNHLKEECQYGSTLKSLVLTLTNVGNVPYNRQKRILSGLSIEEIEPCEGYLAKLQKQASKKLDGFLEELRKAIISSKIVYWDDTVVSINGAKSCMRYYGTEQVCLFKAHEKKDKIGIDEDKILALLGSSQIVEHDHNKVNYNDDYSFINAECCQHLIRDLRKVKINIPDRTWCEDMIELFQKYDHKRKVLIADNIDTFSSDDINDFILKIDQTLLKGLEENENDSKPYYAEKEKTLISRIIEYRDNYIYWILDFDIPFTNNLSERNLRGIKSKMKISGQFQNVERASDYAKIRSYIETCRLFGINEYQSLTRLVEDEPYTYTELLTLKNK